MGGAVIILCLLCVKYEPIRYVAFFLLLLLLPIGWLIPPAIGFFLAFVYKRFDIA